MEISVFEPNRFVFEQITSLEMIKVATFIHIVADTAGQSVHVFAFDVDGRGLGEPFNHDIPRDLRLRQGTSGTLPRRFRFGYDNVVWLSGSADITARLIGEHIEDYWVHWALVVDSRNTSEIAQDVLAGGDLWSLQDTIGTHRAMAMVKYEPSAFFAGKVAPQFWDVARALLMEMPGARENYYTELDDR